MRVGSLTADYIDGKEYFLRLNQLPESHALLLVVKENYGNLKTDPDKEKLYFTIRNISHNTRNTLLEVEGSRVTLVLNHDWHIGME